MAVWNWMTSKPVLPRKCKSVVTANSNTNNKLQIENGHL